MGMLRKTFVLDESHQIIQIFEKATPSTNAQEILENLKGSK